MNTGGVLSVPGFLQLEFGSQFRVMNKISHGGSASVFQVRPEYDAEFYCRSY
jgi:hypothetical protein